MNGHDQLDLAALRQRLSSQGGKQYWRSLEELAGTPEFQAFLDHEFPQHSEQAESLGLIGPVNRRQMISLMGASLAMAGLTACSRPDDKIVPYVTPPEYMVPGKPLYYATSFEQSGLATGVLVESHLGRPTKIEGNPDHPASLGATDAFTQASILQLYDPDRSQTVVHLGNISSWEAFQAWFNEQKNSITAKKGQGLHILTEAISSPTLVDQFAKLQTQWPQMQWHVYEPAGRDAARAGSQLAFGEVVNTVYDFEKAAVIVSLGSDFLCSGAGSVRYTRQYAARRREAAAAIEEGKTAPAMTRLYVAETTPTSTGAAADHRLPVRASEMEAFTRALAAGIEGKPVAADKHQKWIEAVARDLKKNAGACVVIAGDEQPAMVHALAHQMNHALGNFGKTVVYTTPVESASLSAKSAVTAPLESLVTLNEALKAGDVDLLIVIGSNPRYSAPGDIDFAAHFGKARQVVHAGLYQDETAEYSHWHLPLSHYLESWGDTRAFDGTASLVQPLIAPLYDSRSAIEIMSGLLGKPGRSGYDIVREYWKAHLAGLKAPADFEPAWRRALHDGVIPGTAAAAKSPSLKPLPASNVSMSATKFELVFRPDSTVGDGRWANNGWLQELPKSMTRLTWDNVAQVSPADAEAAKLQNGSQIQLVVNGHTMKAPVWVTPGQASGSITVTLGYGRWRAGRVGTGVGFNAYELRSAASPWFQTDLTFTSLEGEYPLSATHTHHQMEGNQIHGMAGRNPVRAGTAAEFAKDHDFAAKMGEAPPRALSLYPEFKHDGYGWGLAVDLSSCVGCNACVVACQSENNIPIVGKDQVSHGREMHWIRIDRYYEGELDNPDAHFQPVMCQQCENAPCEVVCPVGATAHSAEGLNDMVYNRCVGTRYCANNCPYKVRRFNYLAFQDWDTPSLNLMRNPNVTTRSRGVMEKCTYCVQRIQGAKIEAEKENRQVRDGEIQTACQQVCPAQAIVFGNIHDPNSRVSKLKSSPLNYGLLEDLQTRPRTSYQARLRNPNPELEKAVEKA
jgi:MoCo/4Fe-4S cofactor protein with predicted Tat translocation signal